MRKKELLCVGVDPPPNVEHPPIPMNLHTHRIKYTHKKLVIVSGSINCGYHVGNSSSSTSSRSNNNNDGSSFYGDCSGAIVIVVVVIVVLIGSFRPHMLHIVSENIFLSKRERCNEIDSPAQGIRRA